MAWSSSCWGCSPLAVVSCPSFPTTEFVCERFGTTEGHWDRDRVSQIITNLIANASTYGAGAPVGVRIVGDEAQVTLHVHNQGQPIPVELIPQLFEPLRRGTGRPLLGNIGLGLFIVSQVVRTHGGAITVESLADRGTTFSVMLPRGAEGSQVASNDSAVPSALDLQPA